MTQKLGYDHSDVAETYVQNLRKRLRTHRSTCLANFEYPVLFWLRGILKLGDKVLDLGGSVGNHYYCYQRFFSYPSDLRWVVCELPEIAEAGERLKRELNAEGIRFTTDINEASGADVLLASGVLQYLEDFSVQLKQALSYSPTHVIINRIPLYDGGQFVTLQNGFASIYPAYVFNRNEFIGMVTGMGYELVDLWDDLVDGCMIPGHPEHSLRHYNGLYFKSIK